MLCYHQIFFFRNHSSKMSGVLKEKNTTYLNLLSSGIIFQKLRNKDFLKQKLREFVTKRPALQEMLKEVLQRKENNIAHDDIFKII